VSPTVNSQILAKALDFHIALKIRNLRNLVHFSQVTQFNGNPIDASIYSAVMQDDIQRQILSAILLVLRPIARALLRAGVGYREFSEIAKVAFVETATKDYGLRGRPTNISRVAVMTGLTRKEVRKIRQMNDVREQTVILKTTPASQILHRWFTDEEFLGNSGIPRSLPFDGEGLSFAYLVRKYGGDVPPGAMRTELLRIKAIQLDDKGQLQPLKRIAYNVELYDRLIGGLAGILFPAALNLAHNLEIKNDSDWWVNLAATSRFVRKDDRGRIMRISSDRINEFVQTVDDIYGAYEALYDSDDDHRNQRAIGVGVFYFEEDKSESNIF